MKRRINMLCAVWLLSSLSWAQAEANLEWAYSTTLPHAPQGLGWRIFDGEHGLTASTGESLWWVSEWIDEPTMDPDGSTQHVIVWLDKAGQPNQEMVRSYQNVSGSQHGFLFQRPSSVRGLWVDANRAVVSVEQASPLKRLILEMEKTEEGVNVREYEVPGMPLLARKTTSDPSGFFTSERESAQFIIRRYRFGATATPVLLFRVDSEDVELSWESQDSWRYFVETSNDLRGWNSLAGPLTGTGLTLTYSERLDSPARFFRIRAEK